MAETFRDRLSHAWNAFTGNTTDFGIMPMGRAYSGRQDLPRYSFSNEQTIINSIYTQIALDAASVELRHIRVDDEGRFKESMTSGLDYCLTVEANIDQTASEFRQDLFYTVLQHGAAAIVPVVTTEDPRDSNIYDVKELRVGEITEWMPRHVRLRVYDDNLNAGERKQIVMPKTSVAIITNPRYAVMNAPNSTLQRLIRKLNLLDVVDEQSSNGKLDLIIQLPYVVKSEARRAEAIKRAKDVEIQLMGSKYGVAYTDGTEKITQLNRPVENNLMTQIPYLTNMVYNQLGMTEAVLNGSADEKTMLNYQNSSIEPLLRVTSEAISRTFLTKTARKQGQQIKYFRDPFKLVPVEMIADIADKFTRAQALTANEIRDIIGRKPVSDPSADQLKNPNLNQPADSEPAPIVDPEVPE